MNRIYGVLQSMLLQLLLSITGQIIYGTMFKAYVTYCMMIAVAVRFNARFRVKHVSFRRFPSLSFHAVFEAHDSVWVTQNNTNEILILLLLFFSGRYKIPFL